MTRREEDELAREFRPLAEWAAWRFTQGHRWGALEHEDIVQMAMMAAVRAFRCWDPSRGTKLQTYVVQAMRNEIAGRFRDGRYSGLTQCFATLDWGKTRNCDGELLVDTLEAPDDVEREVLGPDGMIDAVMDALPRLKQPHRDALQRVYLDGLRVYEHAAECGMTPKGMAARLHDAREAIRRELGVTRDGEQR